MFADRVIGSLILRQSPLDEVLCLWNESNEFLITYICHGLQALWPCMCCHPVTLLPNIDLVEIVFLDVNPAKHMDCFECQEWIMCFSKVFNDKSESLFSNFYFWPCGLCSPGPFYRHALTLIPTWTSNQTSRTVWDEITYPFPKLKRQYRWC